MRMNIKIFVIASLLFVIASWTKQSIPIFAQEISTPSVIINEIGALEPSETEWVEIYNKSTVTQDLTGWKF